MKAVSSARYCSARGVFCSPWYQITPVIGKGSSGDILPLKRDAGTHGSAPSL